MLFCVCLLAGSTIEANNTAAGVPLTYNVYVEFASCM